MGGGELIQRRPQSKYFGSCVPMTTSPSCFPVKHEDYYTRIHRAPGRNNSHDVVNRIKRRWRNLLRRLVCQRKIMSICGAPMSSSSNSNKRLTFHYDAVSYAQNFDEGCHHQEDHQRHKIIPSNKKNNSGYNNNFIRDFKSIGSTASCSR
ncbi:hypothetical protein C5167_007954 [Papaver somniferum]|uniref:Uncharacterized protein n=1 Tax=Papaver somniferum TaxID=3469 RepID=A0A4Y7JX24_PAPSO|nr:hypothetical protein C5167_007954 [Papaver somniferum]